MEGESLKLALVSTGLGRVLRGFESFTESLFRALRRYTPDVDVTLFQGGGPSGDRRVVVPNLHRYDAPARWFGYDRGNLLEKRSSALFLYPRLRLGGYGIVHYNELVMGSALFHLRRYVGGKFRLLYCNGAPSPPIHYHHRCDFAQMLTGPMYAEARAFGIPEDRLALVPYGVDAERFTPETRSVRERTRRELGIPAEAEVVLTVAALNRQHKRIDYVIREVAQLGDSVWLVAAGQRTSETASLEKEAQGQLPGRWRFVSWPHDRVHLLYGAADAFVLASLSEGLPVVSIESMFSDIPTFVHDGPLFRWITEGTSACRIDMSREGALAKSLKERFLSPREPNSRAISVARFSWEALVPAYTRMYSRCLGGETA